MCYKRRPHKARGSREHTTDEASSQGDSDVQTFLPHLIAFHRAGQLPIERLVRHYPQAAINDAVADMLAGTTIKAVLQIGTV